MESVADQSGKVFIITGANQGLGFHCAKMLAAKGGTVVLACRNEAKASAALAALQAELPSARLQFMQLDVSSMDSVNAFADAFIASEHAKGADEIVVVHNAGIMALPLSHTADGREMQWATNVDGQFLLTARLLPLLKSATAARIVTVSSAGHKMPEKEEFLLEDIDCKEKAYDKAAVYGTTKCGSLWFARGLAKRLAGDAASAGVKVVACHPGLTATNLQTAAGVGWVKAFAQNVEYGALNLLVAAVDPTLESGAYVGPSQMRELKGAPRAGAFMSATVLRDDLCDKFWAVQCERTKADWGTAT